MTEYKKYIGKYERIPYNSFVWKFGSTSFRTRGFNRMTEWQLQLLEEFWKKPENKSLGWEKKYMAPGQNDIYDVKNRYYDWLVENEFTTGDERVKYKAAREKTSGLYDMGLINENHRLTDVGRILLNMSKDKNSFLEKTDLNISKDSQIYLEQLLKLSSSDSGCTVRPLIVVLYLLSKLKYLTYDEFKYLAPLCTSSENTRIILSFIRQYRSSRAKIDDIIKSFLMNRKNYREGLNRFTKEDFSQNLLLSVCMNRKSSDYDKKYVSLYREMHAVYMCNDTARIRSLFSAVSKDTTLRKWKELMFNTSVFSVVKKDPIGALVNLPASVTKSEHSFKKFFFLTMHLFKAKSMLEDYFDLNRRYLGLTNCFLFEDSRVKLDVVPKQLFDSAITELYKQAYQKSLLLFNKTSLAEICSSLQFDKERIIDGINKELKTHVTSISEAYDKVDKIRYTRFDKLVNNKFTDENLIELLNFFDERRDDKIRAMVTDNAEVPAIFEYILGVIWYKTSDRKGDIRDFLKRLDADLLPVSHASGGEPDIVYKYYKSAEYPKHDLLLEATLADSTNQRRMEMEPVSRHLGNYLLETGDNNNYCVFASTTLQINVISDFRGRKGVVYCDPQNPQKYVNGMKIIPLSTKDLRYIIEYKIPYSALYKRFALAYDSEELHPLNWYEKYVKIDKGDLVDSADCQMGMAADNRKKYRT